MTRWTGATHTALEEQIREAFQDAPYPGDDRIADGGDEGECLASLLRGYRWDEVPLEVAVRCIEVGLAWCDVEGLCYFLPAFMLAALRNGAEAEAVRESVLWTLFPTRQKRLTARIRDVGAALTLPQRVAV